MKIKPIKIVLYIFALMPLAAICLFYGRLPEVIPTHWDFSFNVDVWSSKPTIWLFPLFSAVGVAAFEFPVYMKTHEDKIGRTVGEFVFAAVLLFATVFVIYNSL